MLDKKWILYIDDEPNHCALIWEFMRQRSQSIEVLCAFTPDMAKEALNKHTFDLIFLDLKMPKMNGRDFLIYLRDQNIKAPVLILTAYPEEIPDLEAEAFEIRGFFTKPVHLEELLTETKKILNLV